RNLTRRHLKPAQRAGIAAKAMPLLKEEARQRMLAGVAPFGARVGKASAVAAAMTGASPRQVERANAIAVRNPDTLEQVIAGDISISEAQKHVGVMRNAGFNSNWDVEWYTPKKYIEAVRDVLGGIDLDPASCERANEVVKAAKFYTATQNGLNEPWQGRVWL